MAPGFCKDEYPLHRAGCEIWDGHVFVHLEVVVMRFRMPGRIQVSDPADAAAPSGPHPVPLRDQLDRSAAAFFGVWQMGDLRLGRRIVYDVKANWKLIVLNYNECLHCPNLHPASEQAASLSRRRQRRADGVLLRWGDGIPRHVETMSMDGKRRRDVSCRA